MSRPGPVRSTPRGDGGPPVAADPAPSRDDARQRGPVAPSDAAGPPDAAVGPAQVPAGHAGGAPFAKWLRPLLRPLRSETGPFGFLARLLGPFGPPPFDPARA